jgi:hypothetical protein
MNATLSTRQVRVVGLLVLVVVAAGAYLVTKHSSSTPTTASSTPAATTPTHTTPSQTTPTPSKAHANNATPVKFNTYGMPVPVARALRKHSVVVVSLTSPGSDVDALAAAEARAGAMAMGAGYVNLDVFHQRPGTAILRKLGVLNTPAVLVVKKRANVYSEFKGFVDRNVVEQAVADAR